MKQGKRKPLLPDIKKDVTSFILGEEGEISKQVAISFGALLAALEALNVFTKAVSAQNISAAHSHCDPAHCSSGCHANCGGCTHYSAGHGSCGWHGSAGISHTNSIKLTYG